VLLNLCGNAIAAMCEAACERRRLTLAGRASDNERVLISVTDTGPGIEADRLESIFEPFATTKPHGIGMGLAISRTIVEAHGGRLVASNHVSDGATFCFDVPIDTTGNHHE
jgi:C4-dicarboxylate-specific signal transduction histidine kinase